MIDNDGIPDTVTDIVRGYISDTKALRDELPRFEAELTSTEKKLELAETDTINNRKLTEDLLMKPNRS